MKRGGVYKYECKLHNVQYVGETARSFETRDGEHRKATEQAKWAHSGLTQHKQYCTAPIEKPEILSFANCKKPKDKLKYNLRVEEALHIRRFNCGPENGMNEDWGSYVRTTAWTPVFSKM
jgi:hypothetical protein